MYIIAYTFLQGINNIISIMMHIKKRQVGGNIYTEIVLKNKIKTRSIEKRKTKKKAAIEKDRRTIGRKEWEKRKGGDKKEEVR